MSVKASMKRENQSKYNVIGSGGDCGKLKDAGSSLRGGCWLVLTSYCHVGMWA